MASSSNNALKRRRETALALALVLLASDAVAVLGTWPPARGHAMEASATTTGAKRAGVVAGLLDCNMLNENFAACEAYVTTDLGSVPSVDCCREVSMLERSLGSGSVLARDLRSAVCNCIQAAQRVQGVSDDVDPQLSQRCGLGASSVPRILSTTDCSTF